MDTALVLKTKVDTKNFDKQIEEIERKIKGLEHALETAKPGDNIREMNVELEKLRNKLTDLYKKQNDINNQGFKGTSNSLSSIKDKMSDVSKSVMRWGLALLGVRSAMTLIRGSLSILSQYDDQLAKNVEYIRYAIAMTLKPVIEYIVDLIFKILQYVNYIAQAWFGVNLFAKASAKSFTQTNKALSKSAKEAKKLNKELLSFDKINKLNKDNTSSASSGGTQLPTTDLSKILTDQEVPEWLKWLADNKDELLSLLAGIGTYLLLINLGMSGIQALGFAATVYLIVEALKDLDKWEDEVKNNNYDVEKSFGTLGKIIAEIGLAITILGITIGSLVTIASGMEVALYGIFITIFNFIGDKIKEVRALWSNVTDWLVKNFGEFGHLVGGLVDALLGILDGFFNGIWKGVGKIYSGLILCLKGDWKNGIITALKGLYNMAVGILNMLIEGINGFLAPYRAVITTLANILGKNVSMNTIRIPTIKYLAKGGIISYPGKGVPIGTSAIAGERGQEGVLPLTDNQAMERLGESIGKHVKVQLDLTTEIEGRVLARVLKQINNEDSFARNGG